MLAENFKGAGRIRNPRSKRGDADCSHVEGRRDRRSRDLPTGPAGLIGDSVKVGGGENRIQAGLWHGNTYRTDVAVVDMVTSRAGQPRPSNRRAGPSGRQPGDTALEERSATQREHCRDPASGPGGRRRLARPTRDRADYVEFPSRRLGIADWGAEESPGGDIQPSGQRRAKRPLRRFTAFRCTWPSPQEAAARAKDKGHAGDCG